MTCVTLWMMQRSCHPPFSRPPLEAQHPSLQRCFPSDIPWPVPLVLYLERAFKNNGELRGEIITNPGSLQLKQNLTNTCL